MNTSEQINELAAALAAAQGEMTGAFKDAKNPHFRSDYSTLASVIGALREPLSKHGIAHLSGPGTYLEGTVQVTTMLTHKSGQWVQTTSTWPIGQKVNPQTMSSAVTYAKRVNLCALTGLESTDDDDGNAASGSTSAPAAAPATIGLQECKDIGRELHRVDSATEGRLLKAYQIESITDLPAAQFQSVMKRLKGMPDAEKSKDGS